MCMTAAVYSLQRSRSMTFCRPICRRLYYPSKFECAPPPPALHPTSPKCTLRAAFLLLFESCIVDNPFPRPCLPVGEGEAGALLAAGGGSIQDGDGRDDGVDHGDGLQLPAPHSPFTTTPHPISPSQSPQWRRWRLTGRAYLLQLSILSIAGEVPGERLQRSPSGLGRARSQGSGPSTPGTCKVVNHSCAAVRTTLPFPALHCCLYPAPSPPWCPALLLSPAHHTLTFLSSCKLRFPVPPFSIPANYPRCPSPSPCLCPPRPPPRPPSRLSPSPALSDSILPRLRAHQPPPPPLPARRRPCTPPPLRRRAGPLRPRPTHSPFKGPLLSKCSAGRRKTSRDRRAGVHFQGGKQLRARCRRRRSLPADEPAQPIQASVKREAAVTATRKAARKRRVRVRVRVRARACMRVYVRASARVGVCVRVRAIVRACKRAWVCAPNPTGRRGG